MVFCFLDFQFGELSYDEVTDVRGTVSVTKKGSCEV